jgi:hypothetical protein
MQKTGGTLRTFYRVEDWPVGCAKLALQGVQGGGSRGNDDCDILFEALSVKEIPVLRADGGRSRLSREAETRNQKIETKCLS